MTTKQRIIDVVQNLGDDITIDQVIDRLYLLKKIETGLVQADTGEVTDHDEFMDSLQH
jgi:predicted transcriptional regulator